MPSERLNLNEPFDEFDFKPILNPPPSFYQLKPVKSADHRSSFTAPRSDSRDYLDQAIDTISAPQTFEYDDAVDKIQIIDEDQAPPIPNYDLHDVDPYQYNHDQPVAEAQVQIQRPKSDFLLKKAFRKVSNLFDNLFYRG